MGSNGRYEFNVGDGSSRCDYDGPAGAINDGEWHHVAFSLSRGSAGQLTLFLDAKVVGQKACGVNSVSSGEIENTFYFDDFVAIIMIQRSNFSSLNFQDIQPLLVLMVEEEQVGLDIIVATSTKL